jgi:hypothetical protein
MSAYDSNTDFKDVPTESEGDGDRYGSNQMRELMRMLNDLEVPSRLVRMRNPWRWTDTFEMAAIAQPSNASTSTVRLYHDIADGKLKVLKSDGTLRSLEEQPGTAAAHKNQHKIGGTDAFVKADVIAAMARYLETVLGDPTTDSGRNWIIGSDMKYWDAQTTPVKQTLERLSMKNAPNGYAGLDGTSKISVAQVPTIVDANIATHTSTRISITNKAQLNNQIAYRDVTLWLTDAMIAASGITTRSKLPAPIAYKDGANDWGAFYQDHANMTAPAAPAAGRRRLYVDAADGRLKVKTSAGAVIDLETTITPPPVTLLPDGSAPPTSGKWGAFWGGANDGTALMAGVKKFGDWSTTMTSTTTYTLMTSEATDDELGGFVTNNGITRLDRNPVIKFAYNPVILTERNWAGFLNSNEPEAGTDYPLEGLDGCLYGFSDIDANWQIIWNNAAATPQRVTLTTPKDGVARNVQMTLTAADTRLVVTIDGAVALNTTTAVPGNPGGGWNLGAWGESIGGTAMPIRLAYFQIKNDK